MPIISIKDSQPFINEEGIKWWFHKDITEWARRKNGVGKPIDVTGWLVEDLDGVDILVLVDRKAAKIIMEDTNLESIGARIDMLRLVEE